jgi:acyl-CoA thioesterase-1
MFGELAAKHGALLYPFFLDGIALDPSLNLGDGLHPNGRGVARIVAGILPLAEQLLEKARARARSGDARRAAGGG